MRIALATPYSPRALTGVGVFTANLASGLMRAGHDVAIVAPSPERPVLAPPPNLVEVSTRSAVGRNANLAVRTLRALKRLGRFDVIHVQQAHPQAAAVLAYRPLLAGTRVATLHLRVPQPTSPLRWVANRAVEAAVPRLAHRVAYVCRATARQFRRATGTVIPNGVDARRFAPDASARDAMRSRLGLDDAFTFLFLGRWDPDNKGLYDALEAFRRARDDSGKPLRMLLVGGDSDRHVAEVHARLAALRLQEAVRVAGAAADPMPFYLAADAFLLPSRMEGMPLSLLEAMACGLPPVASAVGGIPEVVEDGRNGFLVAPGDVAGLAAVLRRLPGENFGSIGRRARETIVGHHTLEQMVGRYLTLYAGGTPA